MVINLFGITGAALASLLAPLISFILINITNYQEFSVIKDSFSLNKHKQAANDVLKIIFENKNPEKIENIKDWIKIINKNRFSLLKLNFTILTRCLNTNKKTKNPTIPVQI